MALAYTTRCLHCWTRCALGVHEIGSRKGCEPIFTAVEQHRVFSRPRVVEARAAVGTLKQKGVETSAISRHKSKKKKETDGRRPVAPHLYASAVIANRSGASHPFSVDPSFVRDKLVVEST